MKKIILLLAILIIGSSAQAQKEMNWWYFGSKSGLNFNIPKAAGGVPDLPTPVTGPVTASEGCFSISDPNGNFLFASDGKTVYNKEGATMDSGTGLAGNQDSAQSGIVVPFPGDPNKYYIITVDISPGICFSVVDLSINGGLGKVITKNTNLWTSTPAGSSYENIAVVRKADNSGFWLVHQNDKNFYVWELTAAGFGPLSTYNFPAINVNVTQSDIYSSTLKFSNDNTKLAVCRYSANSIITASFNTTTGVVSDVIQRTFTGFDPYSSEFSPSGEWLYIGQIYGNDGLARKIRYDDLRTGKPLISMTGNTVFNWQLGPDKRIYGIKRYSKDLYVIIDPDNGATDVKLIPNYLINSANLGVPTFMSSFFSIKPVAKKFACTGYNYKFTTNVDMSGANVPIKLSLDYGDGNTGTINLVAGQSTYEIAHAYQTAGTYTVTITPVKADSSTLSPSTVSAEAVDCLLRTNRMIRIDLQNVNTATGVQP